LQKEEEDESIAGHSSAAQAAAGRQGALKGHSKNPGEPPQRELDRAEVPLGRCCAFPFWVHKGVIYCRGFGQQGVTLQHLGCISSVRCKVLQPQFFCHQHLSCFPKPGLQIYGKWGSFGAHGGAPCRYSSKVLLAPASTATDTALFLHVQDSNASLDFCKPGCLLGAPLAANPSKPQFLHFLPSFQCSSAI